MFPNATTLWGNANKMLGYDIMLLSCEGSQYADVKMPFYGNVKRYGDSGGRIFASHLHFNWLWKGPAPWPMTAVYTGGSKEENDPPSPATATVDTTFPKGAALADWLVAVGATPTRGQIDLYDSAHSVAQTTPPTQRWIYLPTNPNDSVTPKRTSTQYMTFNTPVEAAADAQCGRVVHTDIHVKAGPVASGESRDKSDPGRERHAVPERVHVGDAVPPGEGAGVPVLRSDGLRAARHRPAGAAAGAAARHALDTAGRRRRCRHRCRRRHPRRRPRRSSSGGRRRSAGTFQRASPPKNYRPFQMRRARQLELLLPRSRALGTGRRRGAGAERGLKRAIVGSTGRRRGTLTLTLSHGERGQEGPSP